MYESSTHKILSILITVQVCKTTLKSGFDFLVRSVHILPLYFRQTVCKEIQKRADGRMGDVASIFYISVHTLTPSKKKQRKMKCLVFAL